jgi:hypothetical protein
LEESFEKILYNLMLDLNHYHIFYIIKIIGLLLEVMQNFYILLKNFLFLFHDFFKC